MLSTPPRSPRLTLAWGGGGTILATLLPFAWQSIQVIPPAVARLNYAWEPIAIAASAAVLVAACVVLAVGIGSESGIAGGSLTGKIALIAFAVVGLAVNLYNFVPPDSFLSPVAYLPDSAHDGTGQISQQVLVRAFLIIQGFAVLGHVALAVASVFVIRARVLHGAARWGLAALAVAELAMDALWRGLLGLETPVAVLSWGPIAVLAIQLVVGVLFVAQARVATAAPSLRVVTP
jgi:hypothetical protein